MTDEQIRAKITRAQDLRWRSNAGAREECEAIQRDLLRELPGILDALGVEIARLREEWEIAEQSYEAELALVRQECGKEIAALRAFRDALDDDEWKETLGHWQEEADNEYEAAHKYCPGGESNKAHLARSEYAESIRAKLAKALESSRVSRPEPKTAKPESA